MADSSAVLFGVAHLYAAPFDATNTFPSDTPDTGDFGKAWVKGSGQESDWQAAGYTQEGISFAMSVERGEIPADQVLDPLFRPITGRSITLGSNLIEFTPENLQLGLGQGEVTSVAPGAGTRGYDEYSVTANVSDDYRSWGVDAEQPTDGEPFRMIVWKGLATGGLQSTLGQRATAARIPIEITALPDDSGVTDRILTIRKYAAALPSGG